MTILTFTALSVAAFGAILSVEIDIENAPEIAQVPPDASASTIFKCVAVVVAASWPVFVAVTEQPGAPLSTVTV